MRSAPNFPCLILIAALFFTSVQVQAESYYNLYTIVDLDKNGMLETIIEDSNFEILQHPNSQDVCEGLTANFQVIASGSNLNYQWQTNEGYGWYNINDEGNYRGTTTANFTVLNTALWMNGQVFRVVVSSNPTNQIISNSALLNVKDAPAIWTHPVNSAVCIGGNTSFVIYSSGTSFQWQVSTNEGGLWTDLVNDLHHSNVFTSRLEIKNASESMNNNLYRAKVSRGSCSIYANPSRLTVFPVPIITKHPTDQWVSINENAIFKSTASGNGLTYQWQASNNGSWYDIPNDFTYSGTSTNQLMVKNVQRWQEGYKFRLEITNNNGCRSYSNGVFLNIGTMDACGPNMEIIENTTDNQNAVGTNKWIGHVYEGKNFETYIGNYSETSAFDQDFGGNLNCFQIFSNSNPTSIYTETFSVRYRMNSSLKGLYILNIGSDDGSRLSIDGSLVYNNWSDRSYTLDPNILINLTGNSNLKLEFYENFVSNRIKISEPILIIENKLTKNISQNLCAGSTSTEISGDVFGSRPPGITLDGTGYQWVYSTGRSNEKVEISGAIEATFTPNVNAPPFNQPGTYKIYRIAKLTSGNNKTTVPYTATNVSNPATLVVNSPPTIQFTGETTICEGETTNLTGTLTGTGPWTVNGTANGVAFSFSVDTANFSYAITPTETTTYIISSITDATGCTNNEDTSVSITLSQENEWTGAQDTNWNNSGNWRCNTLPTINTNVLIPAELKNYPLLNSGAIGTAKNIEIEAGASLEILNNELQISGKIINKGNFVALNGSLTLNGDTAQTIPENTFLKNRIRNLSIENPANVTLEGNFEIIGILKAAIGNLEVQDTLTLISDENQTALIDGSGTCEINGTVKMQRYLGNSFGYKYFSSPFQNSTVGDFQDFVDLNASFPNFYRYNNNRQDNMNRDATGWENYITHSSPLNIMQGYALNFGAEKIPETIEITGKVNNGAQQISLYNNNGKYTKGFNLVGNPYPSPIDWNATTGWTKTNIDDAIYFFTAGNSNPYTGTYTSYVNGISSSDGKSSNIIPSMQGFFVHVSDETANSYPVQGTLGMTNEVRVTNFSQEFLKSPELEKHPLLRITAGFENEDKNDPLVIYFNSYSSPGFEKNLDAHKLMNTAVNVPNFYSITPEKDKLAINAIPNPTYKELNRISLGLKTEKAGTISIRLKNLKNISSGAHLYLIDQEKRMAQDLNSNPEYKFQAKKGQIDSRFYLMFSKTRITDPAIAFDEPFSVETVNSRVLVKMNLKQGESGSLRVSSVSGQTLEILKVAGKEAVEIQGIKSTGVYFISLLSGKEKFTRKVLFKK